MSKVSAAQESGFLRKTLWRTVLLLTALAGILVAPYWPRPAQANAGCNYARGDAYAAKISTAVRQNDAVAVKNAVIGALNATSSCPQVSTLWRIWLYNYAAISDIMLGDTTDLSRVIGFIRGLRLQVDPKKLSAADRKIVAQYDKNLGSFETFMSQARDRQRAAAAAAQALQARAIADAEAQRARALTDVSVFEAGQRWGTVVYTRLGCDYFIAYASTGYAVLEWYGGPTPDRGDSISGTFEQYGFHDIFNRTQGSSMRIYVEDYFLSRDSAFEKLNEQCA